MAGKNVRLRRKKELAIFPFRVYDGSIKAPRTTVPGPKSMYKEEKSCRII